MEKKIIVQFPINGADTAVRIIYNVSTENDVCTISCAIGENLHSRSLQLNKFELRAKYSGGIYTALYNEHIHEKNIDTVLFADKAYKEIMLREKKQLCDDILL